MPGYSNEFFLTKISVKFALFNDEDMKLNLQRLSCHRFRRLIFETLVKKRTRSFKVKKRVVTVGFFEIQPLESKFDKVSTLNLQTAIHAREVSKEISIEMQKNIIRLRLAPQAKNRLLHRSNIDSTSQRECCSKNAVKEIFAFDFFFEEILIPAFVKSWLILKINGCVCVKKARVVEHLLRVSEFGVVDEFFQESSKSLRKSRDSIIERFVVNRFKKIKRLFAERLTRLARFLLHQKLMQAIALPVERQKFSPAVLAIGIND